MFSLSSEIESSQSTNTREQTLTMRLVGQNENVKYSDVAVFWTRVWDGVCRHVMD